ncbi:MAG: response regulator [Myxococcales bacterium]|nr:response regulator [Myxococcales bacterium]
MAKFLVVDDSAVIREYVGRLLVEMRHIPFFANDGVQALAEVDNREVDAVITDIHMPEMDGIVLIQRLRDLPEFKSKPILVLTTEMNTKIREAAMEVGATGYINKPIEPDRFKKLINRVIG